MQGDSAGIYDEPAVLNDVDRANPLYDSGDDMDDEEEEDCT